MHTLLNVHKVRSDFKKMHNALKLQYISNTSFKICESKNIHVIIKIINTCPE